MPRILRARCAIAYLLLAAAVLVPPALAQQSLQLHDEFQAQLQEIYRLQTTDKTPESIIKSYLQLIEQYSDHPQVAEESQTKIRDGKSNTIAIGETLAEHAWVLPGTADAIPPGPESLFGSRHPEGANFVFCDASVHFIREDIDPEVFTALCTIDGKESVTDW